MHSELTKTRTTCFSRKAREVVAFREEINISRVKREEKTKLNAPAKRLWYELRMR